MVGSSEVRIACPSISFLFARLGGSLGVFPHVENFVFEGNSLGVVLTELCPLLCQSLDWFEGLVREKEGLCLRLGLVSSTLGCRLVAIRQKGMLQFLPLERLGLFMPSRRCVGWMLKL